MQLIIGEHHKYGTLTGFERAKGARRQVQSGASIYAQSLTHRHCQTLFTE